MNVDRLDRFWRYAVGAAVISVVAVVAFPGLRGLWEEGLPVYEGPPFYVGTNVPGDQVLVEADGTKPDEPPARVRAAACRNYRDSLIDRTLNTDVVILDDPGLLRSAELLAGEFEGEKVILEAEELMMEESDPSLVRNRLQAGGWTAHELQRADRYLQMRDDPPTTGASERYVTYVASRSTSMRWVVRLAVDPDEERVQRPVSRIGDIAIKLPDGSVVLINESKCWR